MSTIRKTAIAVIVFIVMVCLMTVQKASLYTSIRSILHQDISIEAGYVILTLVILPPYLFSVFLTLWNVPFILRATSPQSPRLSNICIGILASLVESGCVVIFVTRVFSMLPLFISVLAMHGILGVSCLLSFIKTGMKTASSVEYNIGGDMTEKPEAEKESVFCCNGARIILSAMCVLAFPAVALFLFGMGLANIVTSFSLAVIPCLLGLVWTKELQEYISNPSETDSLWDKRVTFLYSIVKSVGVVGFILLELYLRSSIKDQSELIPRFLTGFNDVFDKRYIVLVLLTLHASNLLCLATTHFSLSLCLPLFGFVLPSMFSTASSITLCVTLGKDLYSIDETSFYGSFSKFCICGVILTWAWVWPYISRSSSFVRKPMYLLTPYKWLFLGYEWNPVFSHQRFFLGYDTSRSFKMIRESRNAKNRIYICTTMYREADYEMERLLVSLEEISKDDCLKNVHLESNIFMDNGCNGDSLNEFAIQLVSLLITKFGVEFDNTHCCRTPYGIQLFCKLRSGLPVFIHFKDPKKVKTKKRWSQTMYINYVMRFRKARWRHDSDYLDLNFTGVCSPLIQNDGKTNGVNGEFILSAISHIGSDKLTDFKAFRNESDQGFSSVDESTPPASDFSIQTNASGSSKASSEVDSIGEENQSSGFYNFGYNNNESDEKYIKLNDSATENKKRVENNKINDHVNKLSPNIHSYGKSEKVEDKRLVVSIDDHALVDDDHTFILATDADMDFKGKAVKELLDLCNADMSIGAACGRTHPIGKKRSAVVWHQVFEYAKDFWMIKNAQNIIGSVSCCPGCFSLYRASAIRDVMNKYASPTRSPFSVYVKDTGEDRWMATLMMINGWKMRYSPFADNSTYCPDTFQEYYKQRKRWILSDMANAVLAMRNLIRLIRNNACFSLVYVIYLVNMFLNNIITPGTAIVMITAGLELVFSIPYIYTTVPLTLLVYAYAILCTWLSVQNQGIMTSMLTAIMGSLFAAVAVYGTYKISAEMAHQIDTGDFHFQQHYVILLLALSLVYAGLMHPSEVYQFIYGLAYLFIFPAMHILLPIYSIANIIDQSWGTRDSNTATISCSSCFSAFKCTFFKKKQKQEGSSEPQDDSISTLTANLTDMADGDKEAKEENAFWHSLVSTSLGVNVNLGMKKEELADRLRIFRNRCLFGFMLINAVWLSFLSYFYMGLDSPLSKLNIYGVISGALYGFTLVIQIVGLTGGRIEQAIRRLARFVYGDDALYWVNERPSAQQRKKSR